MSPDGGPECRVPRPPRRNPRRVSHATGLGYIRFRSPLLTESLLFSLPPGTEMFHFPGFPPPALYIQAGVTPHHGCRVPPFGHPRINARLTAPRGLSRPPTSFIGSWYQGIHHAPLHTYTPTPATSGGPHTAFGTHQEKQHTTGHPHPAPTPRETGAGHEPGGHDARIHYPVHKHPPTTTPHRPRHHPHPTPNPTGLTAGRTGKDACGGGCYGARDGPGTLKDTPPPPTPATRTKDRAGGRTRARTPTHGPGRAAGRRGVVRGLFSQDPTARRPPPTGPAHPPT